MFFELFAAICLAWYASVVLVCTVGCIQLIRNYSTVPKKSISSSSSLSSAPHVTILRPVKGIEPHLYECLAATFHQDYPSRKLTLHLCISSRDDPAYPILQRLLRDFPAFDARILVEGEDPALIQHIGKAPSFGPNPKIRNMSRGYREAKGDIVWIIDCNVWVSSGVCGRMVDTLCGFSKSGSSTPFKFVHQLPICVDVGSKLLYSEVKGLLNRELGSSNLVRAPRPQQAWLSEGGGRLEELFLSSSHAKFYTAINTVAVAPCIVGKSNMFRRSHLNYLTSRASSQSKSTPYPSTPAPGEGIDHFSYNICEDHLIGDLLWRSSIPHPKNLGNHALLPHDLAIQPISQMSLNSYLARRVRWLRVRKFTVTLATLVEPGTESLLCSAYGAYGATHLTWSKTHLNLTGTWSEFALLWLLSIAAWASVDWCLYILLHSGRTIQHGHGGGNAAVEVVPPFARPLDRLARRPFSEWVVAWLGREALALPIWVWAFWGGVTVVWKERRFWVGMDMRVHEIEAKGEEGTGKQGVKGD